MLHRVLGVVQMSCRLAAARGSCICRGDLANDFALQLADNMDMMKRRHRVKPGLRVKAPG